MEGRTAVVLVAFVAGEVVAAAAWGIDSQRACLEDRTDPWNIDRARGSTWQMHQGTRHV